MHRFDILEITDLMQVEGCFAYLSLSEFDIVRIFIIFGLTLGIKINAKKNERSVARYLIIYFFLVQISWLWEFSLPLKVITHSPKKVLSDSRLCVMHEKINQIFFLRNSIVLYP